MKSIKKILQMNDITLSDFAAFLKISRPTLNNYIGIFENSEEIPNQKYNIIFNELFGGDELSKAEFIDKLSNYKNMLERDAKLGISNLSAEMTDLCTYTIKNISKDFKTEDFDKNIYIFINMLISNYKREPIFNHIVKYFLVLNGIEDYKNIDFHADSYLLHYYQLFSKEKKCSLDYDENLKKQFLNRIKEINNHTNSKNELVENKIKQLLEEEISKLTNFGIKISEEDLLDLISKKLNSK